MVGKALTLKYRYIEIVASRAKLLSVRLLTQWLWVRVPLPASKLGKIAGGKNFFVSVIFVLSIINFFLWNAAKKVLMRFALSGDNRLICLIDKEFII